MAARDKFYDVVCELIENRELSPCNIAKKVKSDFIVTENYHIRLRESAVKMLSEKIENNLNKRVEIKW